MGSHEGWSPRELVINVSGIEKHGYICKDGYEGDDGV